MIHGHSHVSKLQTRKWTGEFGTQEGGGGVMDMESAKKAETQTEREVTKK